VSGSNHPLDVVAQAVREHRAASPHVQAVNLAALGGMIVGAGANLAVSFGPQAHDFSTSLKLGFAAVMIWGLSLIVSGWRRRGERDIGGAVMAILVPGIGFYLLITYLPGLFNLWWGRAFCTGTIVASAIEAAVCLASPNSRAFDLVAEDIANNEWEW
jgi:hypothetical protein